MRDRLLPRLKARLVQFATRAATSTAPARSLSRAILNRTRSRAYRAACCAAGVDERTVVFECYAGRAYACSPRALYQAMLADDRFSDFEFVWVLRPDDIRLLERAREARAGGGAPGTADVRFGSEALSELEKATVVEFGSPACHRAYARAGTWVSNYILPAHLHAREGQRYLQTWHGTPLKRLGCDISADKRSAMFSVSEIHARYRAEGSRFDWLVSPSPFASEKLADAFCLPPKRRSSVVLEAGYPRNDALARPVPEERRAEIRSRLGIRPDRKVVLYAPTFRDDQHSAGIGYTLAHTIDLDLLRNELGDGYVVLYRAHYLLVRDADLERHGDFVIDVSDVSDVNDLYLVSDVLVTDYSSVFFDFANLMRPIVFFMPDVERYRSELRGFYLDLEELPGPVVHASEDLVGEVRAASTPDADRLERLRRFRERFAPLDDGDAASRVLDHLFPPAGATPLRGGTREDIPSRDVL